MGIILPAFVIIFFTFEFGNEYKFKVGIIDKDDSYASEEIVKVIDELEDVETIHIKEKDYKMLLVSQQIQMAIIINNDFQEKKATEAGTMQFGVSSFRNGLPSAIHGNIQEHLWSVHHDKHRNGKRRRHDATD